MLLGCEKCGSPEVRTVSPRKKSVSKCPKCGGVVMTVSHDKTWYTGEPGVLYSYLEGIGNEGALSMLKFYMTVAGSRP